MKSLIAALALVVISTAASAATYQITGGTMSEWAIWQKDASGICYSVPNCAPWLTILYADGAAAPPVQTGPYLGAGEPWILATAPQYAYGPADPPPATYPTSYSGTIVTNDSGTVTGGTFTLSGAITSQVNFPYLITSDPNDYLGQLYLDELYDITWDLATGSITAGSLHCRKGHYGAILEADTCTAQSLSNFTLIAGNEGFNGTARPRASFNPGTGVLVLFHEQFTPPYESIDHIDIDQRMTFTLTTVVDVPYNLVGYYERSIGVPSVADGTLRSLVFRAGAAQGCPGPTYVQPCYDPANADTSGPYNTVTAAGPPAWTWNGVTLKATGDFRVAQFPDSNPGVVSLLNDRVTGLTITPSTSTTNAATYQCYEGSYLLSFGENGCKNLYLGPNGSNDTSRTYNVGGNAKCVSMTISGDDYSRLDGAPGIPGTSNPRGLTVQAAGEAGVGCAQTFGAFDLWQVIRDNGTYLTLANTANLSACYLFGAGVSPGCPSNPALAGARYMVFAVPGAPDTDGDGNLDGLDNCPTNANADQLDTDRDGRGNVCDNCRYVANNSGASAQCDANGDGYGNRCDGDLNGNNFTNAQDYAIFRSRLGTVNAEADLSCDGGNVNAQDFSIFRALLGTPPGPGAGP